MLSEENADIKERYLLVQGIVSAKSEQLVNTSLPSERPTNSRLFFIDFNYADVFIPKDFDVIFVVKDPTQVKIMKSRVIAVTQQFNEAWQVIPHGWKTICLIEFPEGVPGLIDNLSVLDVWSYPPLLGISSLETWQAILDKDNSET